ncbi:MAG: hypothetical protein K0R24_2226 [Gammaproteobacteria bacterium]|jgi:hypothetical protein|nr:hypothetical protein [Gammaproteobacteria bacterium]
MEALKPQFAAEIISKIKKDVVLQSHLAKNLDPANVAQFEKPYLESNKVQDAINSLMNPF